MSEARRLRHLIVYGALALALVAAVVIAKSGCEPGAPFLAGGTPWGTYAFSIFLIFMGWGTLALDALGFIFAKLGWEPNFQPVKLPSETGDEGFTPRQRKWLGYPLAMIIGSFGFWLWSGMNGCDVIVAPPRGP